MIPAVAPILRQTLLDTPRPLGGQHKDTVAASADRIPAAASPFVSTIQKEIRRKAELHKGTRRAILILQFVSRFALGNYRGIPSIAPIHIKNKAILTSRTAFLAAMPRIPRNRFFNLHVLHLLTSRNDDLFFPFFHTDRRRAVASR